MNNDQQRMREAKDSFFLMSAMTRDDSNNTYGHRAWYGAAASEEEAIGRITKEWTTGNNRVISYDIQSVEQSVSRQALPVPGESEITDAAISLWNDLGCPPTQGYMHGARDGIRWLLAWQQQQRKVQS
jgi:hypothetical protein